MSNVPVGIWSNFSPVNESDKAFFKSVVDSIVGVEYKPSYVATKTVNGTNYAFFSTATGVYPKAPLYLVIIYIYKPSTGEAHITTIEEILPN